MSADIVEVRPRLVSILYIAIIMIGPPLIYRSSRLWELCGLVRCSNRRGNLEKEARIWVVIEALYMSCKLCTILELVWQRVAEVCTWAMHARPMLSIGGVRR
jgi:hypothetical protein